MTQAPEHPRRWRLAGLAIAVITVSGMVVGIQLFCGKVVQPSAPIASADVVTAFHVGLAALDIEQSERAARVLAKAVELEPGEPALWANLAIAYLRMQNLDGAKGSLEHALLLAPDSRELALLQVDLLNQSGEIESAIEHLRKLHPRWPENIAATFSLVTLLGQVRNDTAESERLSLLSEILERAPANLRARCEQARIAATLRLGEVLQSALVKLHDGGDARSEQAKKRLADADKAALKGEFVDAARSLAFFENLLKPTPEYQQSLAQLGISSLGEIGHPLRTFFKLKFPVVEAAEADTGLTFELREISETAARPDLVLALEYPGEQSSTLCLLSNGVLRIGESAALPFPGSTANAPRNSIAMADLNFDFVQDLILAGPDGCRIFVGQEDGSFLPQQTDLEELNQPWHSVWSLDIENDGDLDLVLRDHKSRLRWIRNNGDMTFSAVSEFIPADSVVDLQVADFDSDGTVDLATIDASGLVTAWQNRRAGDFEKMTSPCASPRIGIAIGDVDRDGQADLVSISKSGEVHFTVFQGDGSSVESSIGAWKSSRSLADRKPGDLFLAIADIDNNGGVDIIASTDFESAIWLRSAAGAWERLPTSPTLQLSQVVDTNNDGLLDLVGLSKNVAAIAVNRSQAGYGWHVVRPTASTAAGDKRINSFGVGGRIEVRAGNLAQAAVIRSPRVHFGLGNHQQADVARIIWPNGTVQAEFELNSGQTTVAHQRLKGSCPWIFAFDGKEYRFVKDFIWRSPLGLRINAQSTVGVTQTEDWIKIPGTHLVESNGLYSLRVTAELWETHFFDHVRLLAVDHPRDVEILIDERFVPNEMPNRDVIAATPLQPLLNPTDHHGNPLDAVLKSVDGVYADGFALGEYQGVAEEHWLEFELPDTAASGRPVLIVGHGWIYPTDSSINVAISQRGVRPHGLVLEQQQTDGFWQTVHDNLGFPAGKNKNVVIEIPEGSLSKSRKFRLRTNMEIYLDSLGWSFASENSERQVSELPVHVAELRHRGFSQLKPIDRRRPDTPVYQVASTRQQWLDLEGFYTRYGDVRELLAGIDDRYVIMNAGDELVFEFRATTNPPAGWRRDFVLIGDGWVKDGDFNTAFSRTVRPLPTHDDPDYAGPLLPLEADPVVRRFPDDWRLYHTRYVSPRAFHRRLWSPEQKETNE